MAKSVPVIYRYNVGGPLSYILVEPFVDKFINLYCEIISTDWEEMGFSELNYRNPVPRDILLEMRDVIGFMQSRPDVMVCFEINKVGVIAIRKNGYSYYGRISGKRGFKIVDSYGIPPSINFDKIQTECIGLLKNRPITSLYPAHPNKLYIVTLNGNKYISLANNLVYLEDWRNYSTWDTNVNKISSVKLASSSEDVLGLYFDDKNKLRNLTEEDIKNGFRY